MAKTREIPVFDLHEDAQAGFFMRPMTEKPDTANHDIVNAHRDNSYLLLILKAGYGRVIIDFEEYTFTGPACCLIHPDQVHGVREHSIVEGWMIAFDPGLLIQESLPLISQLLLLSIPDSQTSTLTLVYKQAELLWQIFQSDEKLIDQPLTIRYLLNALLTTLASLDQSNSPTSINPNRGDEITSAFRQLLKAKFSTWKRPAQYAQHLHLSVNHLNDTVKSKTGYSVSYWIQYQTMLEARRLLYHTQQTIKGIAYQLGFEDQHYFSRLFHKVTGQTPIAFRQSFRDLSTKSPL